MDIETRLVKRVAKSARVCTSCENQIRIGEAFHLEEGINKHLHSLLAREFCSNCYAKYGEKKLLGTKK